jgi:hypothetical protein
VLRVKSHDYATNEDVLSTFKLASKLGKTSAKKVLLLEVSKKVLRLSELLDGKKPKNESIEDSIQDCRNYLFLLQCVLNEDKNV